jgi:hypothetical protein
VVVIVSLALALGTTMRYEVDFATVLLIAALLVWFVLVRRSKFGRVVAVAGGLTLAYSSLVGLAISFTGYYDWFRGGDPGVYQILQRATSPLPTVATMIVGHPDIVRVIVPGVEYPASLGDYGTSHPGSSPFWLQPRYAEVDIVSPATRLYHLSLLLAHPSVVVTGRPQLFVQFQGRTTAITLTGPSPCAGPLRLHRGLNRVYLAAETPGAFTAEDNILVDRIAVQGGSAGCGAQGLWTS